MRPRRLRVVTAALACLALGGFASPSAAQTAAPNAPAAPAPSAAWPQPTCTPNPIPGRALYLRGSFNSWTASESQRFTWACDHFELVTTLSGAHEFKLGDEDWSADADWGLAPATVAPSTASTASTASAPPTPRPWPLLAKGRGITFHFTGTHRLTMTPAPAPQLRVQDCPAGPPLGAATLFLRGGMNNWAALDSYAFQWSCDAYYLNVHLSGPHNFKLADAAWGQPLTFGVGPGSRSTPALDHALPLQRGSDAGPLADLSFTFSGEHTLKLDFHTGAPRLTVGPLSFADPTAPVVTHHVALSLRFDSRNAAHKSPFGAVPAGSTVQFAVDAAAGVQQLTLVVERRDLQGNQEKLEYTPLARIAMTPEVSGQSIPDHTSPGHTRWRAAHRFDQVGVVGYWFEAVIDGQRFVYQNNADAVHWTREKGSGGLGAVADMPQRLASLRRYRLSVYEPQFTVPSWAPDAVYYYIFPERYRNGDASNDPRPGQQRYQDHDIEFHTRWTDKPYKPGSGDGSDKVYNNDFYGGDIAGIIEKLDDISDLGANTLYITPLFKAASNHKYDTADYLHIDPGFGSNADFTRLTEEAAKRGMRVVPDASLNHTGSDSRYFNRFGNYPEGGAFDNGRINPDSPYASWYRFDAKQKSIDKQYTGWVGVLDLPELNKQSPAWRDFAYRAPDSVTRTWLQRGAMGWRMDVAPWVPDDFWREWRGVVKQTQPQAITIAETWFDAGKHLLGDMFDSTMNYIFRNALLDYAGGGKAQALAAQLELMRESYPPPAHSALMNLLSTHDQARSLHVLGHVGETTPPGAVALAKQRFKLAVLFQMTYPGSPAVYYGDEVGLTGGEDPYNRATYPWPDRGGQPDLALRAEFKRLIQLRHDHPVLRHGSLRTPLLADDHALVLARQLSTTHGTTWAITATNNATQPRTVWVDLPEGAPTRWRDALTGATFNAVAKVVTPGATAADGKTGQLQLELPPLFGVVLIGQ